MKGVSERDDKEDFIEVETTREKVDNQIVLCKVHFTKPKNYFSCSIIIIIFNGL